MMSVVSKRRRSSFFIWFRSQSEQIDPTSPRRWFRRLKVITLPRNLVCYSEHFSHTL